MACGGHVARLVSWEWAGLLLLLVVVRQVAIAADDQRRLVAILLATTVAVSVNAGYQIAIDLPIQRKEYPTEAILRQKNVLDATDPAGDVLWQRVQEGRASATFTRSRETLARLPGPVLFRILAGDLAGSARSGALPTMKWALVVAILMVMGALLLTRSGAAVLAVALVAVAAAALTWRQGIGTWLPWLTAAGLLLAGLGVQIHAGTVPSPQAIVAAWVEPWQPTLQLLRQVRGSFGIGPGNFADAYLSVMPASAAVEATQPNNLFLEAWAMAGPGAALGLVLALGYFFVRMARAPSGPILDKAPIPEGMAPLRAELYLGGMLGLLLSFLLRAGNGLNQDEILAQAWPAGVRSLVWFAAYALFERIGWTDRNRGLALTAGVAALCLTLLVSGGIGYPALAASLWAAVGLALNTQGPPPEAGERRRLLALWLPLPVLTGVTALFVFLVFWPVASATNLANSAQAAGREIWREILEGPSRKPVPGKSPTLPPGPQTIYEKVLRPLREASNTDPDDARWHVRLAHWNGRLWRLDPTFFYKNPSDQESGKPIENGVYQAERAEKLDPAGRPGYRAQYRLDIMHANWMDSIAFQAKVDLARNAGLPEDLHRLANTPFVRWLGWEDRLRRQEETTRKYLATIRSRIKTQEEGARKLFAEAAQVLERELDHDPNNAWLHGLRAEALLLQYGLGSESLSSNRLPEMDGKTSIWEAIRQDLVQRMTARQRVEQEARRALDLDAVTPRGPRGLTDQQRETLQRLLQPPSPP